jgi:RsiW-degrading membrane proteinase PrsW (M82 family)
MEANKPTMMRRRWRTLAFVFSPLGLAFLWCAFVDREAFGAFILGVLFTGVFGVVVLVRFLIERSDKRGVSETHDI